MYKDSKRTCTAIVELIKPFVWWRSRFRCRRCFVNSLLFQVHPKRYLSAKNSGVSFINTQVRLGARFSKLPVKAPSNYRLSCFVSHSKSFISFENGTVKLSAKETKWISLEVSTHPTFLETLIKNMISGPLSYRVFRKTGPRILKLYF